MDELNKVVMNEIDDDELDMVAGGCGGGNGNGKGHDKGNGKGHHEHGNGWGKGHDGCGGGEEESGGGAEPAPAANTVAWTCIYCGNTFQLTSSVEASAHMQKCPKNPNACL